jgi:uncharacterized membrane protein YgcG
VLEKVVGCEIDWKPNMSLTYEEKQKKQRAKKGKNKGHTRIVTEQVPKESFFNFFTALNVEKMKECQSQEEAETMMNLFNMDYSVASFLRSEFIPNAVANFTGDAAADDTDDEDSDYNDSNEDDSDDSDDDEDDDEDDDDDDDDESMPGLLGKGSDDDREGAQRSSARRSKRRGRGGEGSGGGSGGGLARSAGGALLPGTGSAKPGGNPDDPECKQS